MKLVKHEIKAHNLELTLLNLLCFLSEIYVAKIWPFFKVLYFLSLLHAKTVTRICIGCNPPPYSTGRRFRNAHGDLGFSLKLFQISAEA